MDVIEATAEALPLELLNRVNKNLTTQLSQYESKLEEQQRKAQEQRQRLQSMQEHLGNVRAEIVNTQSLAEGTRQTAESVENMCKIVDKECHQLKQRQIHLTHTEEDTRDKVNTTLNRIFTTQGKVDALQEALHMNEEELQQWDAARRQKEEDELAIAQYSKQDEAKLKQLRLTVEKMESKIQEVRTAHANEMLATHKAQIELDQCASAYKSLHDERSHTLNEWENVIVAIAERDKAIELAASEYAEGITWLQQRQEKQNELIHQLEEAQHEKNAINDTITNHEKTAQQFREAIPFLTRQVEGLHDELEASRAEMERIDKDKRIRESELDQVHHSLLHKAEELAHAQIRKDNAQQKLTEAVSSAADMKQQTDLINALFAEANKTNNTLDIDIEKMKKAKFAQDEQLHELRRSQNTLLAEINGAQAQGKSLHGKMSELDEELMRQQGILYNIEFSVQQMEKKVSRARGERNEDEKKELHHKIHLLQNTLDELEEQHKTVHLQVKRVTEELRQSALTLDKLQHQKRNVEESVVQVTTECIHSEQEMKELEQHREDELIKVDTMELQLERLRKNLQRESAQLISAEDKKEQLTVAIAQREAEMAIHENILHMEKKINREERKTLADELRHRQHQLNSLKNRHEVLIGGLDPSAARLSQSQLVIAAAKERESLQLRGDGLDSRIRRMEKEMLKLEKTINILKASNNTFKHKFDKLESHDEQFQVQKTLQDKFRELKQLLNRRNVQAHEYGPTLSSKQHEKNELDVVKEKRSAELQEAQSELNQITNNILQSREASVRYEQAIARTRPLVDETICNDIALLESRERFVYCVQQLLHWAEKADVSNGAADSNNIDNDDNTNVKKKIMESVKNKLRHANLPLPEMNELLV